MLRPLLAQTRMWESLCNIFATVIMYLDAHDPCGSCGKRETNEYSHLYIEPYFRQTQQYTNELSHTTYILEFIGNSTNIVYPLRLFAHIVTCMCDYRRGLDSWLDLLTTYTLTAHDYNLQINDNTRIRVLSLLQSPLAVSWQRILTQELYQSHWTTHSKLNI
jgi:hypothetical protein